MSEIWKFPIEVADEFTISMPAYSQVLFVATQGGEPFLWAAVDPTAEPEERTFHVRGTGHPVEGGDRLRGHVLPR